jgi:hypothetical protein
MKHTKYIFVEILLLLLHGCAFHSGTFHPSVVIPNASFRVVGTAFGQASTFHFLGIGGLNHDAIIYEARQQFFEKYPIAKGMLLANATVNEKHLILPFGIQTIFTLTCDIIDTRPEYVSATYKGFYTDDSTYFPMHYSTPPESTPAMLDIQGFKIGVGKNVNFRLNQNQVKGKVIQINSFGVKCEYEVAAVKRYVYLRPTDVYVTD